MARPSKIRTLIVDDEPPARDMMNRLLRGYMDFDILGECANGEEAVKVIERKKPDVVFLDVQMPGLDGFGVLERLKENTIPVVIFVTAYDQYALKAFEASAIDYILKPYDHERLDKAVDRVRQLLSLKRAVRAKKQNASFIEVDNPIAEYPERILVRKNGRIQVVNVEDVDWVEAAGDYIRLRVHGQFHLIHETLGAVERKLDPTKFGRIHRSTIVNVDRIKDIESVFHGDHNLTLKDGKQLSLSRTYADRLFAILKS